MVQVVKGKPYNLTSRSSYNYNKIITTNATYILKDITAKIHKITRGKTELYQESQKKNDNKKRKLVMEKTHGNITRPTILWALNIF